MRAVKAGTQATKAMPASEEAAALAAMACNLAAEEHLAIGKGLAASLGCTGPGQGPVGTCLGPELGAEPGSTVDLQVVQSEQEPHRLACLSREAQALKRQAY